MQCFHPKLQLVRKMGILRKTFQNKVSIQWVKETKSQLADKMAPESFCNKDTVGCLYYNSIIEANSHFVLR